MAITASAVTVGSSEVLLFTADADGSEVSIHNNGSDTVFLGPQGVSTVSGLPVGAGVSGVVELAASEKLYAVSAPTAVGASELVSSTSGEVWSVNGGASLRFDGESLFGDLPGAAGDYFSTPDSAALDITGDIDLRAYVEFDDPADLGVGAAYHSIIARYGGGNTPPSTRSYNLRVDDDGAVILAWSDGTTEFSTTKTGIVTAGFSGWIRATLDVDNGAGGYDAKVFTSDDGETWTQRGSTVTGGSTTSIVAGDEELKIGSNFTASNAAVCRVRVAHVYDGIDGTLVADFNPDRDGGARSLTSSTSGEVWSVNGGAALRFDGESLFGDLPGGSGDYFSCPLDASHGITGDLRIEAQIEPDDWVNPPNYSGIVGKRWGNSGEYLFRFGVSGDLELVRFVYGTQTVWRASVGASSIAPSTVFSAGETGWLAVTHDVDNGSSNDEVTFYTSPDGISWTQFGDVQQSGGVYAASTNTTPLTVGDSGNGVQPFEGKIQNVRVYDDTAGTSLVADFNPDRDGSGQDVRLFTAARG
jgi:hypothetical protein